MVPNIKKLEKHLKWFCEMSDFDEVILFERATFLMIASAQRSNLVLQSRRKDITKYEKISTMIKQFKHSCAKLQSQFKSMEIRRPSFSAYMDALTTNTYVMVITSDPTIQSAATQSNIVQARKHFEKLEAASQPLK